MFCLQGKSKDVQSYLWVLVVGISTLQYIDMGIVNNVIFKPCSRAGIPKDQNHRPSPSPRQVAVARDLERTLWGALSPSVWLMCPRASTRKLWRTRRITNFFTMCSESSQWQPRVERKRPWWVLLTRYKNSRKSSHSSSTEIRTLMRVS